MVDEMLAAVAAAPSSLPLLQFAAARLWTERDRDGRLLTRASYVAMGGIAGTLADHADAVLGAIPSREHTLVRAIFERLVTPERTRAVVSLGELRELPGAPDDIERLIHRLVDARLLVVEGRMGDDRTAELVHESLIAYFTHREHRNRRIVNTETAHGERVSDGDGDWLDLFLGGLLGLAARRSL
jgi:hypothetical protein